MEDVFMKIKHNYENGFLKNTMSSVFKNIGKKYRVVALPRTTVAGNYIQVWSPQVKTGIFKWSYLQSDDMYMSFKTNYSSGETFQTKEKALEVIEIYKLQKQKVVPKTIIEYFN